MLKRNLLQLLIMLTPLVAVAQKDSLMNRSYEKYQGQQQAQVSPPPGAIPANGDEFIYDRIRNMIKVNDPGYFIGYATNNNLKTWPEPHQLRAEEGANGYVMELRLAQRFTTVQSYYGRKDWLIRTKWLTVNYDFQYRVARHSPTSSDSPGLPLNTKFGFTLAEHVIPLTLKKSGYYKADKNDAADTFNVSHLGSGHFGKKNLVILVPRLDVMHYSNGQHDTARYIPPPPDVEPSIRNNYASGNFSTNYVQGQVDIFSLNQNSQLCNFYIGYRADFGIKNLLSFEPTQDDRYGKQRFIAGGTLRSGPMRSFHKVRDPEYNRRLVEYNKRLEEFKTDKEKEAYAKDHKPQKDLNGTLEWFLNVHYERITDGTKYQPDYKGGITAQTGIFFTDTKTASFMIQFHYGRDYMNVRYDMPVCNFLFGFNFTINGYTAAPYSVARAASGLK